MRKRMMLLILAAAIVLTCVVGGTWAYLASQPVKVENTFTSGKVEISLRETSTGPFTMTPGVDVYKDPTVTVYAGSEESWLFAQIDLSADFDMYMTYEMADGWQLLPGHPGVYYREVPKGTHDVSYAVLKGHMVWVRADLTEEDLAAITVLPQMTVSVMAIQKDKMETASIAYNTILSERRSHV